jgi:hypothetical protein
MDADAIAAAAAAVAATKRDLSLSSASLQQSMAESPPAVNHVAVKLPEFWTKEPVVYAGRNEFPAC